MANKAISELPQAQNVNNQDLFVLEQSGIAKKLTAETFITEQGIIDALAEALDGHGGIQSVTLASVSGRIRTYRITFSDGSATTFQVYDGTSIERISRTSSSGLQDTYTIFMSDGTTSFFTVTNGADGTVSEAMLNDALKDKAPAITETTESSAIANFTDGADNMVMHNVVVEINPVQSGSGDPSPDNIRPISGWTGCNVTRAGKNLFNKTAVENNVYLDTTTGATSPAVGYVVSDYIPVFKGITVFIPSSATARRWFYDTNKVGKTYLSNSGNQAFTPTENGYIRVSIYISSVSIDTYQIEVGSTATAYEPYQSNTLTVDWSTEAGTVYGGTVDVATGLLTVTHKYVTYNGTENWSLGGSNGYLVLWNQTPSIGNYDLTQIANWLVSGGNEYNKFGKYRVQSNGAICVGNILDLDNSVYKWASASEFKAYLADNPLSICYAIATPQTYLLTPQQLMTLLGTNNVWADTGNVSVTYPADTKMFIEKLTMPTEDDLVANQAITSGKYFMIGNSLYLALANIASGAQITIGTNAQRVSLADALNNINS